MKNYILLGLALLILLVVFTLLIYDVHLGENNLFSDTKEAKIVMATKQYIRDNYTPDRADISDDDWLTPGKKLNKKMIIATGKGFQIRDSKWIFLRMKDMYIGIHDKGNNDFIAIAMLEEKGDNWVIFDYFLVNRYNSGRIYDRLRKKGLVLTRGGWTKPETATQKELNESGKSSGQRHDDLFDGVRPDIGKNLHEFGRSAFWNATHMSLGKTGFSAAAGPHKYTDKPNQDWDHYFITIERRKGKASYVYFERDFRMNDIPKDLINKKVQDIVTFDEKSRVVTFNLGTKIEKYTLPKLRSKSAVKK